MTNVAGKSAAQLAQEHWNATPLLLSEELRYSVYPWLYEAAEFQHHRDERVLEIGCGTGCDLLQFARHGAHASGIDITPEHLRLARERVRELAEVRQGDATAIPFPADSFDYVYSHGVLHHLDQPRRMVEEIFRVLRPGGRFNIHVYAFWSCAHLLGRLKYGTEWKRHIENSRDPVHIDLYTGRKLQSLFPESKIAIEKYECRHLPWLQGIAGWFLVAKGFKPRNP
jgi:SAM-dependent methyltransferase